jgi:hypothetical protein
MLAKTGTTHIMHKHKGSYSGFGDLMSRLRGYLVAVSALVLALLVSYACASDDWKKCRGDDPDASIRACTAVIEDVTQSSADMAIAFTNRGHAYYKKDD